MPSASVPEAAPETSERPADPEVRGPAGRARAVELTIAFWYLLLALWIMRPFWADPAHLYPATNTSDPEFFDWALTHAARIFTHGENPFLTPQLNAPLGVSMIANTGLLGLAVPLV